MYHLRSARAYRKAYKRVCRYQNFDQEVLDEVIEMLMRGSALPPKYRDHQLTGSMKEYCECHIRSDILLVYQLHEGELILLLVDIGSHSDLFE